MRAAFYDAQTMQPIAVAHWPGPKPDFDGHLLRIHAIRDIPDRMSFDVVSGESEWSGADIVEVSFHKLHSPSRTGVREGWVAMVHDFDPDRFKRAVMARRL